MSNDVGFIVGDLRTEYQGPSDGYTALRRALRVERDYYMRKNAERDIPKYKELITSNGTFKTGLLPRALHALKKEGYNTHLKDNRRITSCPDMEYVKARLDGMQIDGNDLELRDYQVDSVVKGLQHTRGLFDLATGAGKTVVMAALFLAWNRKMCLVINQRELAYQLREDLSEYMGKEVGFIGDGKFFPEKFTVAIDRSLVGSGSKKKRKRAKEYLRSLDLLAFDEVHHLQSNTWRKISRLARNATLRYGFSGTPETSTVKFEGGREGTQNIILEGHVGPIIKQVHTRELIEKGWLADVECKMIEHDVYFDGNPLDYTNEYTRIIVEDETRNQIIARVAKKAYEDDDRVVIFVSRIKHGELIENQMTQLGVPEHEIEYVHGDAYDRDAAFERYVSRQSNIIIGTVLSEGVNLGCDVGMNAEAGKSRIQTLQKVGRILRKPKTDTGEVDREKDHLVKFFDFYDKGHPWYSDHARTRKDIYREENHPVDIIGADEL